TLLAPLTHQDQLLPATYRDVIMHRWGENRLGIIGDAAHAMSPQLGQGANMALLDARAIGQAVAESDAWPQVWRHYHRQREPQIRFYQRMSRWLTPAFQSHSRTVSRGRDLFFPVMERVPWLRIQMVKTVAGLKQSLLD
ncbi:MAG: FAD-dependent oxidoreductase, partial [Alcanivorax sp.]|uniref:FAD-dependent oxidoreductase n=1 Tax=Alcanivorax sp. TaxID=1872427 RepID=UPI003C643417